LFRNRRGSAEYTGLGTMATSAAAWVAAKGHIEFRDPTAKVDPIPCDGNAAMSDLEQEGVQMQGASSTSASS
jgi:hypothetical protein